MSPPLILSHSTVPASTLGFDVSANTTHLHILIEDGATSKSKPNVKLFRCGYAGEKGIGV
jgi:hypothetical protein